MPNGQNSSSPCRPNNNPIAWPPQRIASAGGDGGSLPACRRAPSAAVLSSPHTLPFRQGQRRADHFGFSDNMDSPNANSYNLNLQFAFYNLHKDLSYMLSFTFKFQYSFWKVFHITRETPPGRGITATRRPLGWRIQLAAISGNRQAVQIFRPQHGLVPVGQGIQYGGDLLLFFIARLAIRRIRFSVRIIQSVDLF